jgi:RNA polymerase sigma factor (sigma-70 family)
VLERCRVRLRSGDAYEVAHIVMVRLLTELRAGKRYPVPFRVVVHQVTTWTIGGYLTRGRAEPLPAGWEPAGDDPYEPVEQGYDLELLFEGLPPRVAAVMRLRYLEGLEIHQIAEGLGLERNAVDQALHRGHVELRDVVD